MDAPLEETKKVFPKGIQQSELSELEPEGG